MCAMPSISFVTPSPSIFVAQRNPFQLSGSKMLHHTQSRFRRFSVPLRLSKRSSQPKLWARRYAAILLLVHLVPLYLQSVRPPEMSHSTLIIGGCPLRSPQVIQTIMFIMSWGTWGICDSCNDPYQVGNRHITHAIIPSHDPHQNKSLLYLGNY